LFGIPRSLAGPEGAEDKAAAGAYRPNTNLEQISDWLTKILVGVGLVQFTTLAQHAGDLVTFLGPALAQRAANAHADLSALHLVMMDEYVEPRGATWTPCPPDAHYSCRRFGDVEIRGVLNAAVAERSQIAARNLHVPDPAAPDQYESLIERLGGIDVFLLASGQTDGHVAFNPQGSSAHEGTRVIELTQETRRDNLATFPQFRDLDAVPRWGVSVGTGTIARHSRAAILMLLGEGKGQALRRIAAVNEYDPDWPASIVLACADAQIVADVAAVAAM
jgi:glucosamine-6-phosphate deaminase